MSLEKLDIMKEKVNLLNEAAKAYYQDSAEIMPNVEYDKLYDELRALEKETGTTLSSSPTVNVGYEIQSDLPKEEHASRMLSLDKTKEAAGLKEWLAGQEGLLSWKLDGLTIVLTYENGSLQKAVTRGNGQIGEVITSNARVFSNLPVNIGFQGRFVLRGEAIIKYSDFETINRSIGDADAKYKNPRNLCSGSVRQLSNRITAERNVNFFAFSLVEAQELDFENSREKELRWLAGQGFGVVDYERVNAENVEAAVDRFYDKIAKNDLPSDGLVLIYDNIAYGRSLGVTSKFPKDAIAFKWRDEMKETTLKEIEWSASRTGLINPVAIFEPVELEGTTVSRASLHNISIMEELALGLGDSINVYKANMIIPQVAENLTRSGVKDIPQVCPVCGGRTDIKQENGVKSLYCINPECLAKQIKAFTHFVSRDAMNMEGMSEATMEKLIAKGVVKELADLFHLGRHEEIITEMEGFGKRSFDNMVKSAEKARRTTVVRLLYSLGIPNIGLTNAGLICKDCGYDWQRIQSAPEDELVEIDGVGDVMAKAYVLFFTSEKNRRIVEDILKEVTFEEIALPEGEQTLSGLNFVITGTVEKFDNRKALKALIESMGGKVTGSVTSKTSYLINNAVTSGTSKNKTAKELGVPIISEEQFLELFIAETSADTEAK